MKEEIFKEIDRLKDSMLKDLSDLIKIESVKSQAQEDAPFGINCKKALDKAIEISKREGFVTKNIDGYMAYASYGKSDDYIGVFSHLDVVESGSYEDWKYPPFSATIKDQVIYSRGALDNKGPSIAALYALICLKNLKIEPKIEIRHVFGIDEESGMSDIDYYLSKEKPPVMGFTPDNKFPAVYAERARANISISGREELLFDFMNKYILNGDQKGKKLGIYCKDDLFGELQIRSMKINKSLNPSLNFQLSLPKCDIKKIMEILEEKARGLKVDLVNYKDYSYNNPNSKQVKILNDVYNEFTGDDIEPTTTTGMTYAHKCKNIIGFGPSFPGQNLIAHLPNEFFNIEDMIKCAKIYAYGLYKLSQLETL